MSFRMPDLPVSFIASLTGAPGFHKQDFEAAHASGGRVTAIRKNPRKWTDGSEKVFGGELSGRVPWTTRGFYLERRPAFFLDPLWHAGVYYVQEPSSMSLEFVLGSCCPAGQPLRLLDLCAAPGGKSAVMADLMPPGSLLVSNEVIASRSGVLEENMTKWGAMNVVVTQNDPGDFSGLENFFDVILVDAPCSGSGLFRKDPEAVRGWSPEQVSHCSKRQRRILADVMPALKEGGWLVYATCSFSTEENEDIADYLVQELGLDNLSVPFEKPWNIIESRSPAGAKGYRFYPDRLRGEGFYTACFRRKEGNRAAGRRNRGKVRPAKGIVQLSSSDRKVVQPWMRLSPDPYFFLRKNEVWAVSSEAKDDLELVFNHLRVKAAGTKIGRIIRDQLVPAHSLAMSCGVEKEGMVNLDRADAVRYLRREAISRSPGGKVWNLMAFEGHPLGWMKTTGGRMNNYYPMDWRIRKKEES